MRSHQVKMVRIFLGTTRGRSGLRHSCLHPVMNRVNVAFQKLQKKPPEGLGLMSYRQFWFDVRAYAEDNGVSVADAFLDLLETEVDPARFPPHPMLTATG